MHISIVIRWTFAKYLFLISKSVSQMWAPLATHCKPVGIQNRLPNVLYIFEHKIYILIHAPNTSTMAFLHNGNGNDFIESNLL